MNIDCPLLRWAHNLQAAVLLFGLQKAATVTPQSWLYDMFMPLGTLGFTSMNLTVLLTTVMLEYLTHKNGLVQAFGSLQK